MNKGTVVSDVTIGFGIAGAFYILAFPGSIIASWYVDPDIRIWFIVIVASSI